MPTSDSSRELVAKLVDGVKTSLTGLFGDTFETVSKLVGRITKAEQEVALLSQGFESCKTERTDDIKRLERAILTRRPIWQYLLTLLPVGAMLGIGVKLLIDFGEMRAQVNMYSEGFKEASKMMRSTEGKIDSLLIVLTERERNP